MKVNDISWETLEPFKPFVNSTILQGQTHPMDYTFGCAGDLEAVPPVLPFTQTIPIQTGPIKEVGPNGVTIEALLAIVIDLLQHYNREPYNCRENSLAITHLQEAEHWLEHRTRSREARGVEGTGEV